MPTDTIYDMLWQTLHGNYILSVDQKNGSGKPDTLDLAGYSLYYDEENGQVRSADKGLFWDDIPEDDKEKILAAFLLQDINLNDEYHLVELDYRDNDIPAEILQACIKEKSLYPLTGKEYFTDAKIQAAVAETRQALIDYGLEEKEIHELSSIPAFEEAFDQIRFAIEERDKSFPERNLFLRSTVHGMLQLSSNYDCWIDIWSAGGLHGTGTALTGVMAVLSLNPKKVKEEAMKQGVACHGTWKDCKAREGKEVVKYDSFIKSLRETPNYGNWAFFGTFDMNALWDVLKDPKKTFLNTMVIPSQTLCGMFNNWNGGGTLRMIRTLRPLPLKEIAAIQQRYADGYNIRIDEGNEQDYGYTPGSVYGQNPSDDPFLTT